MFPTDAMHPETVVAGEERHDSWQKAKQHGNDMYRLGDFQAACDAYASALLLAADATARSVLHANRAQALIKLGLFEAAIADCTQGLGCDPGEMRGKLLARRGFAAASAGLVDVAGQDLCSLKREIQLVTSFKQPIEELTERLYESCFGSMAQPSSRVFGTSPWAVDCHNCPRLNYWKSAWTVSCGKVFTFGGQLLKVTSLVEPTMVPADLWQFDLKGRSWSLVHTMQQPQARSEHVMEAVEGQLIVFGGLTVGALAHGFKSRADLSIYSLALATLKDRPAWQRHQTKKRIPPRFLAASCVDASIMYVFGGECGGLASDLLGDLWSLDTKTMRWRLVTVTGDPLQARHSAAMVSTNGALWIFGGVVCDTNCRLDARSVNTLERVDLVTKTAMRIPLVGDIPAIMCEHSMLVCTLPGAQGFQNYIMVYGGFCETTGLIHSSMDPSQIHQAWKEYILFSEDYTDKNINYRDGVYLLDVNSFLWSRWRPMNVHHGLYQLAEAFIVQVGRCEIVIGGGYGYVQTDKTRSKKEIDKRHRQHRIFDQHFEFWNYYHNDEKSKDGLCNEGGPIPERSMKVISVHFSSPADVKLLLRSGLCRHGGCPVLWRAPRASLPPSCSGQACPRLEDPGAHNLQGLMKAQFPNQLEGVRAERKPVHLEGDVAANVEIQSFVLRHGQSVDSYRTSTDSYRGPVLRRWVAAWGELLEQARPNLWGLCMVAAEGTHSKLGEACMREQAQLYQSVIQESGHEMEPDVRAHMELHQMACRALGEGKQRAIKEALEAHMQRQRSAREYQRSLLSNLRRTPLQAERVVLKVVNIDLLPEVWRRVAVPASMSLASLHDRILCPIMPFERNYHAYCFWSSLKCQRNRCNGHSSSAADDSEDMVYYGPQMSSAVDFCWEQFCYGCGFHDDAHVKVADLLHSPGDEIGYIYDLGDHWRHLVILEGAGSAEGFDSVVELLDGFGAAPPEDIGGPARYVRKLAELRPVAAATMQQLPTGSAVQDQLLGRQGQQLAGISEDWWKTYNEMRGKRNAESGFDPCHFDVVAAKKRLDAALGTGLSDAKKSHSCIALDVNSPARPPLAEHIPEVSTKSCVVCGISFGLKACTGCGSVHYCSHQHQKTHWKIHKGVCRIAGSPRTSPTS